ncbi:MAG: hypothetical protein S4CHLAM6_01760 [Chlamydiae bacterium]|nr:hypothetical protein [Chlamydiota bacterium]
MYLDMNKEAKKKRFVSILSKVAQSRRGKVEKDLAEHEFYLKNVKEKSSLFDYLVFQAILEQADTMSLVFGKPHQFHVVGAEETRLSREAYDTLEKSAILRPTRIGPLSLIG